MASASAPASKVLLCVDSSSDFLWWWTAVWKLKLNKPFPPNLLLGHDICAGIETLTKTHDMHRAVTGLFLFIFFQKLHGFTVKYNLAEVFLPRMVPREGRILRWTNWVMESCHRFKRFFFLKAIKKERRNQMPLQRFLSLPPVLWLQEDHHAYLAFTGDPNFGPHTCVASALHAEPRSLLTSIPLNNAWAFFCCLLISLWF